MDENKCLYCGSGKGKVITVKSKYLFFGCSSCQSLSGMFMPPTASDYAPDYYGSDEVEKTWLKPLALIFEAPRNRRARWAVKNTSPGAGIMDIGCGNGQLLKRIFRKGRDLKCSGIELGETAYRRAAANLELKVYNQSFEQFNLENKQDVVLSIHSFEHLNDPVAALGKIDNLLVENGKVFFAFPNADSWQLSLFGHNWLHLDPPFHAHVPSRDKMVQMMKEMGYVKIHERHFNAEQNVPGFIQSFMNLFTREKDILFNALKNKNKNSSLYKSLRLFFMLFLAGLLILPAYMECFMAACFRKGATIELAFRKK